MPVAGARGGSGGDNSGSGNYNSPGTLAGAIIAVLIVLAIFSFAMCRVVMRRGGDQPRPRTDIEQQADDRRTWRLYHSRGPLGWNAQRYPDRIPLEQRDNQTIQEPHGAYLNSAKGY
ncbi:hypothetical protein F4781DRAFT_430310 [Annulohypoxylon bovei var. microspora]|nr:hypothetical protein F4781DRAFT_430310 [Annulohypoxylon bovei var. microspora]